MPPKPPPPPPTTTSSSSTPLKQTLSRAQWLSYRIGRGEQGVLTFEPYKSSLLPSWRFRTPAVARPSARALWARFEAFDAQDDFVGMDMARKFVQMGMTRAKRYANHAGGRKYEYRREDRGRPRKGVDEGEGEGEGGGADERKVRSEELPKSVRHPGKEEKEQASLIFREVWIRCKDHEGYKRRKQEFLKEQREWMKDRPWGPITRSRELPQHVGLRFFAQRLYAIEVNTNSVALTCLTAEQANS
ncbi:hypothetical protein F5Y17DRAFT_234045 [Xylariaceae sp. FL0594]|nr:hypothetical protein F5Y17DRAFT_234045 [Xylariaceae sp. FL0594]